MRRVKKKPPKEFSKKILIVAGIINAVVIVFTMVMILAYSRPFSACLPYTVSSRRSCHGYGILLLKSKGREPYKIDETKQSHTKRNTFF